MDAVVSWFIAAPGWLAGHPVRLAAGAALLVTVVCAGMWLTRRADR